LSTHYHRAHAVREYCLLIGYQNQSYHIGTSSDIVGVSPEHGQNIDWNRCLRMHVMELPAAELELDGEWMRWNTRPSARTAARPWGVAVRRARRAALVMARLLRGTLHAMPRWRAAAVVVERFRPQLAATTTGG
jgi:hypothetical protein